MADPLDELLGDLKPSAQAINLDALLGDLKPPKPLPPVVAKSITPRAPAPAPTTPIMQSTIDPFASAQDWIPSQPKQRPQPKPSTLAAPGDSLAAAPAAPLAPTIETSPAGKTNAPIPGKIPGMERIGGVAPGVRGPVSPMGEVAAPSLPGDMAGGFVRGAGSAAMSVPRALSRIPGGFRDDLEALRPEPIVPNQDAGFVGAEQRAVEDAINRKRTAAMISRAEDSALPDAPITGAGKVAAALGSTAPYMAAGVLGGNTGTAAMGVLGGIDEAMTRADMSGKPLSDGQRAAIGAGGAAIGSTEALPFARLFSRLKGAGVVAEAADEAQIVKQLFPSLKDYGWSALKQGAEEATQEGVSNVAQDALEASYGGRPTEKIGSEFLENAGTGGAVGVLVDLMTTMAGSRAGRVRMAEAGINPDAFRAWVAQNAAPNPVDSAAETIQEQTTPPPQPAPEAPTQPAPQAAAAPVPPVAPPPVAPPPAQPAADPIQEAIDAAPPLQDAETQSHKVPDQNQQVTAPAPQELPVAENKPEPPAPAPVEQVEPKPGELIGPNTVGARRDSLFPSEEAANSFLYDERIQADDANDFEVRPEGEGWRIYKRSQSSGKYHPWTYFVNGKPVWRNPNPYSTAPTRLEEQAEPSPAATDSRIQNATPAPAAPEPRKEVIQNTPESPAPVDDNGPIATDQVNGSDKREPFPLWDMGFDELEKLNEKLEAEDNELLVELFGEDGAKRYKRASQSEKDSAYKIVEEMESKLTNGQRERLYGIGDDYSPEEVKAYLKAFRSLDFSDPESLGSSLQWELTRLGNESDPSKMNREQRVAYATIRNALIASAENGFDPQLVMETALKSASSRWANPEDASLMLRRFLKNQNTEQAKAKTDLPPSKQKELNAPLPPQAPASPGPVEAAAPAGVTPVKDQGKAASGKRSGPRVQASKTGLSQWTEFEVPFRQGVYDSEWKLDDDVRFTIQPEGPDGKLVVTLYESDGYEVRKEQLGVTGDRFEAYAMAEDAATEYYTPDELREIAQERDSEDSAPTAPAAPESTFGSTPAPEPKANQKVSQSAEPERRVPPQAAIGRRSPAKTARGYKVDTNFAVVPLSSLRISNTDAGEVNPDYPAELQPRQRDRKSSDEQIQTIISQFDPDQLAENYLATDGAPIIGEDMAVESGNGRSMAVRRIYSQHQDKASAYRQWIIENADRFGLDQQKVSQIDQPVLVRIRTNLPEGISRTDFGRDANERTTAGMSPGEQATIDAKAMSDDLVSLFSPNDSGDIDTVANTPFVTAFMENVVPQSERGSMRSGDGRLSTSGIRRIQNAIFAKAYNDRGMIERMTEDPDDNIKSIVGAMVAAAPRFISLRAAISRGDLHNLDISKDLTDAASTLSRLRAEGKVIDDYLAQEDMFGRPEMQDAILATMRDLGRNKAKFGDILNRYMDAVEAAGNPNQIGMFGPAEVPTPLDIWKSIIEREQVNGRTEDNAAAGRLDEGSSRVSKTRRRQEASDPSRAEASGPASPGEPGRTEGTRTSLGNTVEKTKDGLQETLVTDLEARESQLAAKRDRNTPLAEVPFSLVQEDGPPAPEGPDERQVSMFGEDSDETPAYAPRTTAAKRPGSPTPKPQQPSQPAGPGSGRMVSRSEIVKELSDMLGGLPIRTGNIAQRGAQGIFKVRQNVIRSRKALDLDTISHEIGHGLHKYLWGTDKSGKKLQVKPLDRFKGELGALDYDQNQKRPFEGFAEYIRLRLTDPTAAKAAAPQFHAWFEQVMSQPQHADMKAVLDDARDRVQSWIQQPGAAKVAASINVTPEKKNLSEKVSDAIEDYKKNFVDKFEALEKAVDLMSGLGGAVRPEENAFVLARLLSRAVNRYNSATGTRGTVGADHKINGEGLSTILRDAAKRDKSTYNPEFTKLAERDGVILANDGLDDLRVYLVAKRAEKYHKDGFETGFEDAWIQDAINATKTSEVEALAERLYKYQDRILQYMIGKGALSKDVADRFRKGDEFYVPMYRVMDKRKDSTNIGRKMIDLNSPIMKRKGSSREIIDPLESIYRNTYEFMSFADRNEVSQALVKQAEKVQDQGWLIESGIVRPMKRTEFNLSEISKEIKEALKAQGIDATGIDLDEAVAIYRPNMDPKRGDNIVRVIVDGKPKLFQFDPSLIDAMDFFNAQQANLAVKLGMWVKNISTGAFTSFNPTWAISNISIDQLTAATQSRNGYKPFVDAVWGLFKMMTDKKLIEEWELNGGGMTTMEMLSRQQIRKSIREMAHTRHGLILKNPMSLQTLMIAADIVGDLITLPGQLSEKSTRVGEYWLARRSGKSPLESSFDSNNVSLDFARSGRIAQKVNRFIPFFSVFFNATDRTMEMMRNMGPKGDPAMRRRAWTTAGLTAIASLALWLVNKDDEKYKKQERWLRDMYWLIPARWFGLDDDVFGPFVRIQKQPHWGLIFGSSVERAADSIIKQDPNAFEEFEQALWRQAMPPMQAQFMLPPLEAAANYSFFTNRQIESDTMQKRSPVNRYTNRTSEFAKGTSEWLNRMGVKASPVMVEHIIYGFLGGSARDLINTSEELIGARDDRPARGPEDRMMIRALSTNANPWFTPDYKRFNNVLAQLEQKKQDFKYTKQASDRMTSTQESQLKRLTAIKKDIRGIEGRIAQTMKSSLDRKAKRKEIARLLDSRDEILRRNRTLYQNAANK